MGVPYGHFTDVKFLRTGPPGFCLAHSGTVKCANKNIALGFASQRKQSSLLAFSA